VGVHDILAHLRAHLHQWVSNQTLRDVSGVDDVARHVRHLRQSGWAIERRHDGHSRLTSETRGEPRGMREAISTRDRYLVFQKSDFRCRACGHGPAEGAKLVVDHVVPVDWGGSSAPENLQALCEPCNHGKQAWIAGTSSELMRQVFAGNTVEERIETLFTRMPDVDIPSHLVQFASGNALDWQRALRKLRKRTGMRIVSVNQRSAYRHVTDRASDEFPGTHDTICRGSHDTIGETVAPEAGSDPP
jgi:5-methylcytosine-specific restriction endonuclease McrA